MVLLRGGSLCRSSHVGFGLRISLLWTWRADPGHTQRRVHAVDSGVHLAATGLFAGQCDNGEGGRGAAGGWDLIRTELAVIFQIFSYLILLHCLEKMTHSSSSSEHLNWNLIKLLEPLDGRNDTKEEVPKTRSSSGVHLRLQQRVGPIC